MKILSLLFFYLIQSGVALASMESDVSVDTLGRHADLVVSGTVAKKESRWTDDRKAIVTYVTLEKVNAHKGTASSQVTFLTLGGTVGDISLVGVGSPQMSEGERLVVFLRKKTQLWLMGSEAGVWKVEKDLASQIDMVRRSDRVKKQGISFSSFLSQVRADR